MKVCAFDPAVSHPNYDGPATLADSLEGVLDVADFLSLHVVLNDATTKMINATSLQRLKPGCRIINTSRGAVIDEIALLEALRNGHVGGAGLDVFETEPLTADHPLCKAPNILLTPHIASSTQEALENMGRDVAEGVLDVLNGRRPKYVVNPSVFK